MSGMKLEDEMSLEKINSKQIPPMFEAFKLLGKLNEIKSRVKAVKEKLGESTVEEWSADHLVGVTATADKKIRKISINENLLHPSAREDLELHLVAVINQALDRAEEVSRQAMKKELEGVLPDIPGLDLNNLPF